MDLLEDADAFVEVSGPRVEIGDLDRDLRSLLQGAAGKGVEDLPEDLHGRPVLVACLQIARRREPVARELAPGARGPEVPDGLEEVGILARARGRRETLAEHGVDAAAPARARASGQTAALLRREPFFRPGLGLAHEALIPAGLERAPDVLSRVSGQPCELRSDRRPAEEAESENEVAGRSRARRPPGASGRMSRADPALSPPCEAHDARGRSSGLPQDGHARHAREVSTLTLIELEGILEPERP